MNKQHPKNTDLQNCVKLEIYIAHMEDHAVPII